MVTASRVMTAKNIQFIILSRLTCKIFLENLLKLSYNDIALSVLDISQALILNTPPFVVHSTVTEVDMDRMYK